MTTTRPLPEVPGPQPSRPARAPHEVPGRQGETSRAPAPHEVGRHGEEVAARYLTDLGWQVLERNWRPSRSRRADAAPSAGPRPPGGPPLRGELDLVALQPRAEGPPCLVVVEVKTRSSTRMGPPAAAVDPRKTARLRLLAGAWAASHRVPHEGMRLDVVSLLLRPGRPALLQHHQGVGER